MAGHEAEKGKKEKNFNNEEERILCHSFLHVLLCHDFLIFYMNAKKLDAHSFVFYCFLLKCLNKEMVSLTKNLSNPN